MREAAISVLGIIMCWIAGMFFIKTDDMSIRHYFLTVILAALAAYFAVRFIHWAWITPMPFVGNTQQ
jgi:hypothetical protein